MNRSHELEYYGDHVHLDGTLAPRRVRPGTRMAEIYVPNGLVWQGLGKTQENRQQIGYDSEECPQGQFLRHELSTGFSVLQWWDRAQGDPRSACNSTILSEGVHDSEALLRALREHFPHVVANLARAHVSLIEIVRT